jgi:hypothetical protein
MRSGVRHILLAGVDAIFLGRNKVKQGFGSAVKFMKFPILRLMEIVACTTMLVEDRKQEGPVVESTVFNCVIKL